MQTAIIAIVLVACIAGIASIAYGLRFKGEYVDNGM